MRKTKRFLAMFSVVLCLSMLMSVTSVFAAKETRNTCYDVLTQKATRDTNIPSEKWDLSTGDYSGEFSFFTQVHTNYVLSTSTGDMTLTLSSLPDLSTATGNYTVTLRKHSWPSYPTVKSYSVPFKSTNKELSFTGLSTNTYYFITFSKSAVGATITGEFTVTE